MKKGLAYSELTNQVYWIDAKGNKQEITQNFIQVMLLFLHEGQPEIDDDGTELVKELRPDGDPDLLPGWQLKLKKTG